MIKLSPFISLTAILFVDVLPDICPAQVWQRSFRAGSSDDAGTPMNGTEIMAIVAHKGRLYAGTSLWMETDTAAVNRGAQIFRLGSADGRWQVDHTFTRYNQRVNSMKSMVFTVDGAGAAMNPDTLLLVTVGDLRGYTSVFLRNDATGEWTEDRIIDSPGPIEAIRALGFHRDAVTGAQVLFAGASERGSFSGVYDASETGKIRWSATAEFVTPAEERVMGYATCNGVLYCATSGRIYRRTDGPSPSWTQIYESDCGGSPVGIRGLTATDNADGAGEVLLFDCQIEMRRLDPASANSVMVECNLMDALSEQLNIGVAGVLAAYNDHIPAFLWPGEAAPSLLIGAGFLYTAAYLNQNPSVPRWYNGSLFSGFFIRRQNGATITYEYHKVEDPGIQVPDTLQACRTVCPSPFDGEDGRVLYAGGWDCANKPSHNSAWIYKGILTGGSAVLHEPDPPARAAFAVPGRTELFSLNGSRIPASGRAAGVVLCRMQGKPTAVFFDLQSSARRKGAS